MMEIPDVTAMSDSGCTVLIEGGTLRDTINALESTEAKLDMMQNIIRQVR